MSGPFYTPGYPLTLTIPLGMKELEFTYWMRPFTIETMKKTYRVNHPYSTLYIKKKVDYKAREVMDPTALASLSFSVNSYNLESVKNIFREVLTWFEDENKNLLYGRNDSGTLIFNSDYQKLNALHSDVFSGVRTALQIVPTVVEIGQGVMEPGVVFYINQKANAIVLREYEIRRIANFMLNFSFIAYDQFLLSCFNYCRETGAILTYEQVQQRFEAQRQYDTNLRY